MTQKSDAQTPASFSGLRAILWPIHTFELKKFLPMGLMMMLILFIYTMLRDTKDVLVVNAPGSGAEVLAFIKLGGTTPFAILFMIFYAKLSNLLSPEKLFYAAILPFLVFFGAFGFIIYPNVEHLHASHETIAQWAIDYPRAKWVLAAFGNWSYTIFYVLSELWGSVVLSLLFWQFANEITRVTEAKRFYGMFGLIGNVGLLFSGYAIILFSDIRHSVPAGVDPWGVSLKYLMGTVVLVGFVIVAIYKWMNTNVLTDSRFYQSAEKGAKREKPKLSLGESFKYLISSPYLGLIALIVLSYGISINVVEGVWKSQIKVAFAGDMNAYSTFMGKFSATTGAITILVMIMGNNILRRFTWKTAALITPIMILMTSLIFFGVILYSNQHDPFFPLWGTSAVMVAVWAGFTQNVLSKATKYSLFDPTKEMAYIPLDQELKVKGKAAVDVIGGRAGKSGGATVQVVMVTLTGLQLVELAPVMGGVVVVIIAVFLFAVFALSKRFEAMKTAKGEA